MRATKWKQSRTVSLIRWTLSRDLQKKWGTGHVLLGGGGGSGGDTSPFQAADKQKVQKAVGEVQVVIVQEWQDSQCNKERTRSQMAGKDGWKTRSGTDCKQLLGKMSGFALLRKMANQWRSWAKKKKSEVASRNLTLCSPMDQYVACLIPLHGFSRQEY